MNIIDLDYIVYSSHKTATQSVKGILQSNDYNVVHCHTIHQLNYRQTEANTYQSFIDSLNNYKLVNNKKIKIISIIRDPKQRCISSFFQSYHNDEMMFCNKQNTQTTISTNEIDSLLLIYQEDIINNTLKGGNESLDEMSKIFNINIIDNLVYKEKYYYFSNDLFELFVLDFKQVASNNNINYLNECLNLNLIPKTNFYTNLSRSKPYYNKYTIMKNKIPHSVNNIIVKRYNKFYFTAFSTIISPPIT